MAVLFQVGYIWQHLDMPTSGNTDIYYCYEIVKDGIGNLRHFAIQIHEHYLDILNLNNIICHLNIEVQIPNKSI